MGKKRKSPKGREAVVLVVCVWAWVKSHMMIYIKPAAQRIVGECEVMSGVL